MNMIQPVKKILGYMMLVILKGVDLRFRLVKVVRFRFVQVPLIRV